MLTYFCSRTKDLTALRSLQMVTGLFCQMASYETLFQQRLELKAAKFEYLMMNLVVAFFTSDEASMSQGRFSALAFAEEADFDPHSEASLVRLQSTLICRNLVGYLRIKARRPGRFGSPVLFSPQLAGGQALDAMSVSSASSSRFGTPNASFASSAAAAAAAASGRSGPVGRGKLPSLGALFLLYVYHLASLSAS